MWTNHLRLTALTGRPPVWFRPGTAHYDDVAVRIVHELGEQPLGFTVNGDAGATAPPATVRSNATTAAPGSIVLAHMNHPESGTRVGIADAIAQLKANGWEFVSGAGASCGSGNDVTLATQSGRRSKRCSARRPLARIPVTKRAYLGCVGGLGVFAMRFGFNSTQGAIVAVRFSQSRRPATLLPIPRHVLRVGAGTRARSLVQEI